MGGRGSGGSHNAGGKSIKNIGAGITDRAELVNLYNSISGNPSYTAEERVRAMSAIKEKIDEIDNKKAELLFSFFLFCIEFIDSCVIVLLSRI